MNIFKNLVHLILILLTASSCCNHRCRPGAHPEPPPTFCVPKDIRVALVLGSGGVRGMAHVGVLEELEAAGIPIDIIIGCSAGSFVGALYADNPCAADIKKIVWRLSTNSLLDFNIFNCRYGLFQNKPVLRTFDKYLEAENFDQLKIPLVVVATDLYSGELIPIGSGDLVKSVCASCSIPFIFEPCKHLGRVLIDGGTINPVPVMLARDLGAEVIIAVDLCELLPKTFPNNLFGVMTRAAEIAFMWQNEICTRRADVIIRPKTCDVGTFDESKKGLLYEAGKKAAREQMPKILELIKGFERKGPCKEWKRVEMKCYIPQICKEEEEEEEEQKREAEEVFTALP